MEVNCGVSQGSLLGPRLFLLTENDLDPKSREENEQNTCETDLFADDTTASTHDQTIDGLFVKAPSMVNNISLWRHGNCLTIPPKNVSADHTT